MPFIAEPLVLAVDVGSTSARAGVFDLSGRMVSTASAPFDTHRPLTDHAEHDSEQIWSAVCMAVRKAVATCGQPASCIGGVAFDATCSLVMLDADGAPVTVSTTGDDRWNVVMWADHRATAEAAGITATGHQVLDFVGGSVSPEMELPKLVWLKQHLPAAWSRYGMAMDLADFLTWRATGVIAASACTVTCKWTYLNHASPGWQDDLLAQIGLDGLQGQMRIPALASQLGRRVGGLSGDTARAWGLVPDIAVGVPMIDAHAGALGVLGATPAPELNQRLALIAGTSNCHMALSPEPRAVPGVWGPYFGALLPAWWLNEGGQSASGSLLDHVLQSHAQGAVLGNDPHRAIGEHISRRRTEAGPGYASDVLVVPDFFGNRSPLAQPYVRGVIHGLDLDASLEGLARLYHATAVGIAYGTRHIIDALNTRGYAINRLHLTGGHSKSALLVQLYADATGCEVVLPREADGVLLGTALLAATAAGHYPDLLAAGHAMVHTSGCVSPGAGTQPIHHRGYAAFRRMLEQRQEVLDILHGTGADATY
ncbi:MAG: FGGY-family carbohydrate kinase [Rhodoferax sp.]|nr:FGGY-family carbohydrate kinase [Rhodoferax sp.]